MPNIFELGNGTLESNIKRNTFSNILSAKIVLWPPMKGHQVVYSLTHGIVNFEIGWILPWGDHWMQAKSKNNIAHPLSMEGGPKSLIEIQPCYKKVCS